MKRITPDGEEFTPEVSVLFMDAEKIEELAARNPGWGRLLCYLDDDEMSMHGWIKLGVRHRSDGSAASAEVIDCDRRNGW